MLVFDECIICKKPLGADSKEAKLMLCHAHRKCVHCGEELDERMTRWCFERFVTGPEQPSELEKIDFSTFQTFHARCFTTKHTQSSEMVNSNYLEYLNLARLTIEPNMDWDQEKNDKEALKNHLLFIGRMTYEQQQMHLSMLQQITAQVQNAIRTNPDRKKKELNEREKPRFDSARQKALENNGSSATALRDSRETQLATFMEVHGFLPEEKVKAGTVMTKRDKTVEDLFKLGLGTRELIRTDIDADFLKKGIYRK